MNKVVPKVVIISSTKDYSTDFITQKLNINNIPFLRINRDKLNELEFEIDPFDEILHVIYKDYFFEISSKKLKSILFRAPTFLRNIFINISYEEQIKRSQIQAFLRGLITLEKTKWINNPIATFKAEIKPYQLKLAKEIGFNIPETIITNNKKFIKKHNFKEVCVKTIDSAFLKKENEFAFVYTGIYNFEEIDTFDSLPAIVQNALVPKKDIRVTLVGDQIYSTMLESNNHNYPYNDWRLIKNEISYSKIKLPGSIEQKCFEIMRKLKLEYSAIDLVLYKNKYYFIEINPTGEWAWIMDKTGYEIDNGFIKCMMNV